MSGEADSVSESRSSLGGQPLTWPGSTPTAMAVVGMLMFCWQWVLWEEEELTVEAGGRRRVSAPSGTRESIERSLSTLGRIGTGVWALENCQLNGSGRGWETQLVLARCTAIKDKESHRP